jgi:hypothetical protein
MIGGQYEVGAAISREMQTSNLTAAAGGCKHVTGEAIAREDRVKVAQATNAR